MAYSDDGAPVGGTRIQAFLAAGFVAAALAAGALDQDRQQGIAGALRDSLLRPFIAAQEQISSTRARAGTLTELSARVDSLSALLLAGATLAEENHTLRELLELRERVGSTFRSATLLRPGTPGSESTFLLDLGRLDGVREGAPVVAPNGLVGVVREVGRATSVGIDWTHPDFRASAMVPSAGAYGIVENRRGAFREEDRLVLTGTAFNEVLANGSAVLTSGLGGVYPRGLPVGTIDGVADFQGAWRKSYWIRPAVEPASVTHVLVGIGSEPLPSVSWPGADSTLVGDSATVADSLSGSAGRPGPRPAPGGGGAGAPADTTPGAETGPGGDG